MDIKKVKTYLDDFIQTEQEYNSSLWCEKDQKQFDKIEEKHRSFFGKGISPLIGRPVPLPENWFEQCENEGRYVQERKIYQIKAYRNPGGGDLVLCYLGSNYTYLEGKYDQCLQIKDSNGFRIVSRYYAEPLREDEPGQWFECGRMTWYYGDGEPIAESGEMVSQQHFDKPTYPEHLADFVIQK